jgi:hypothetical protein
MFDRAVRLHVYDHFVDIQRPPSLKQTADALDASAAEVRAALGRLSGRRALVLRPDSSDVLMAMPFSAEPTPSSTRAVATAGSRS